MQVVNSIIIKLLSKIPAPGLTGKQIKRRAMKGGSSMLLTKKIQFYRLIGIKQSGHKQSLDMKLTLDLTSMVLVHQGISQD